MADHMRGGWSGWVGGRVWGSGGSSTLLTSPFFIGLCPASLFCRNRPLWTVDYGQSSLGAARSRNSLWSELASERASFEPLQFRPLVNQTKKQIQLL